METARRPRGQIYEGDMEPRPEKETNFLEPCNLRFEAGYQSALPQSIINVGTYNCYISRSGCIRWKTGSCSITLCMLKSENKVLGDGILTLTTGTVPRLRVGNWKRHCKHGIPNIDARVAMTL